ncbi:hypothetical protein FXE51_08010 [Vibrio mimicus]|nr:hypothetical protein FXE51_08010 [Vibrio mimicus]
MNYLLHNGIAYISLDSQNYSVSVEERTGQWALVNNSQSARDVASAVNTEAD